jgi:thioredoxin-like negative regulator of GroEL
MNEQNIEYLIAFLILVVVLYFYFKKSNDDTSNNSDSPKTEKYETLQTDTLPMLVLFHVKWCPHCKHFMPEFNKLKELKNLNLEIKEIDCEANKELAKSHEIKGFPTIRFYPNGLQNTNGVLEYNGPRTFEQMLVFLKHVLKNEKK